MVKMLADKTGMSKKDVQNVLDTMVVLAYKQVKTAGEYEVSFDATSLPTGVYIYKINTGDKEYHDKLILMK